MKRALLFMGLLLGFVVPMLAQEHAEVTVFGDYTRIAPLNGNFYGVGARLGFNTGKFIQFEGEMAYDFTQSYTTTVLDQVTDLPTPAQSSLHLWHGLFGPKLQTKGPVKAFVFAKGGFINFAGGNPSFTNQVNSFGSPSTYGVLYPGGGLEGKLGPIGLRLDVGDEIYFDNGAHNNLKVTFGPTFTF